MKNKIINTNELANFYRGLGDETRIKLILLLFNCELNVNEIANKMNMNQSTISHQLQKLKILRLVKTRRDGQAIYYSLDDDHISNIISITLEHLNE